MMVVCNLTHLILSVSAKYISLSGTWPRGKTVKMKHCRFNWEQQIYNINKIRRKKGGNQKEKKWASKSSTVEFYLK